MSLTIDGMAASRAFCVLWESLAVLFRAPKVGIDAWPRLKDRHPRCTTRPAALEAIALREMAPA